MMKYILPKEIDSRTLEIAVKKKRRIRCQYKSKRTELSINVEFNVPNGYAEYYIVSKKFDSSVYADGFVVVEDIIEFEDLGKEYPTIRKQIIKKYREVLKTRNK